MYFSKSCGEKKLLPETLQKQVVFQISFIYGSRQTFQVVKTDHLLFYINEQQLGLIIWYGCQIGTRTQWKVICFVIAKLSFFTDPHTQFKVDCLLFNHGNTKHWAKKKYSSHHPQHYFKWLVCTNDLLKWKPTYFLSQKKKKGSYDKQWPCPLER